MVVYGTNSAETIDAADGVTNLADTIYGYGGKDKIFGLGGNDFIIGGEGADEINGDGDIDTAFYTDSAEAVDVSLTTGLGHGGTAERRQAHQHREPLRRHSQPDRCLVRLPVGTAPHFTTEADRRRTGCAAPTEHVCSQRAQRPRAFLTQGKETPWLS